ncbi:23S rRNA (pseudouridine(1915)-N(3))-methyltransferase RlmH [Prochlorococcus sp. MIT 1341]|uniref:23S rRNA (pseudouridine(1915)-N(3))-methyltransferase RlmH n=1 Tax=Prochlorococcus sp. MIT 1341 TaxID=3096221 RepID=UPI002A74E8A5|nr:23S rRNA (pseudouridine(1915)-N(3))-methyltransferase RlmH [Prochlorococcus sp. MIT 1341]
MNLSRIRILTVGKTRKKWIRDGIDLYLKRLPGITITQLRDGTPKREEQNILSALNTNETLIALTEEAIPLTSKEFAEKIKDLGPSRLAFAIGGADGLTVKLKESASLNLSLSPMTFPHEIAQLILLEQIYRAQTILRGGPYHRE